MLVVKLQGGLGNQLFQWAYSVALSERFNMPVYLDVHLFGSPLQVNAVEHIKHYMLPKIVKSEILTVNSEKTNIMSQPRILIGDDNRYRNFDYIPNKLNYLDGYWQSEKYIINHRDKILSCLDLDIDHDYDFKDSCSIHVRRGDYTKSNGFHPVQTVEYFKQALSIIKPKGNIFVFSDDLDWCKENLKSNQTIFVENNLHWKDSTFRDLRLMSLCENNIISNSSFSWWAAWINQNPNKKVICPKKWFGSIYDQDHKPESWIKI
jgi:hypothetical protein|tara:strand:+ start:1848 stop:2636 length:789 start_codon:yes stop_codon:yes gene_type:complete